MKEKYQLTNPNNARIIIDYRKEKGKVKFEYVGKRSVLGVAFNTWLSYSLTKNITLASTILFAIILFLLKNSNIDIHNWPMQLALGYLFTFGIIGWQFCMALLTTKSKRLLKLVPHINAKAWNAYYVAKFKPLDIKDKKIEIPLFKNILCDYKATGEMARYLELFEIREHPFNMYVRKKNKPQEYLWKAVFNFSKQPKGGELKVLFT